MAELHVVLGSGALALAVTRALRRRQRPVRLVSRHGRAPEGAEFLAADLSRPDHARRACEGATVVYQCAQPPYHQWPELFPALLQGVIAGAAAAGATLVVGENLYAYGPVSGPMVESLPLAATTRKGMVRAAMTRDLLAAHAQGTVKVAIGRASDFFGPGVTGSAVGDRFFPAALAGKSLDLLGDADAPHSYTYLEDFGEALAILGERPEAAGRAWHVPTAPAVTSRQFAQRVLEAARSRSPVRVVPRWMVSALGLFVPEVRETVEMLYEFEAPFVVDDSAFRKAFGFAGTALSESIPATVRAYAARGQAAA